MPARSCSTLAALTITISLTGALSGCARSSHTAVPQPPTHPPQLQGLGSPEHPVIVRLVGRSQILTVSGGANGPVYSVADAQGRTLLAHATLDELRQRHPHLYQQINATVAIDAARALDARATLPSQAIGLVSRADR